MFTRKKRLLERKSFYITLAAILAVGFLVGGLIGSPEEEKEGPELTANVKQSVAQKNADKIKHDDEISKNDIIVDDIIDDNIDNSVQETESSEYYLVKESDGLIKVYQYDAEGHESLLRTTDISYSLLSEKDQELFSQGVNVNTEDELLDLLQDFES